MSSRNLFLLSILLFSVCVLSFLLLQKNRSPLAESDISGQIILIPVEPPKKLVTLRSPLLAEIEFRFPSEDFLAQLRTQAQKDPSVRDALLTFSSLVEEKLATSDTADIADFLYDVRFTPIERGIRRAILTQLDTGTVLAFDLTKGHYIPAMMKVRSRMASNGNVWSNRYYCGKDLLVWEELTPELEDSSSSG